MLKPTGGWGYHSDTEILYPMRVSAQLKDLRGARWKGLVEHVLGTEEASLEQLAFCLLLIRLNGCLSCHTDCYRAMRGCTSCAVTTIQRYRGDDEDLLEIYQQALEEVSSYMQPKLHANEAQMAHG